MKRRIAKAPSDGKLDPADELVRIAVLQLRRLYESQSELIVELNRSGFSNGRIADLVGTSADYVRVAVMRSKKDPTKKAPTKKRTPSKPKAAAEGRAG